MQYGCIEQFEDLDVFTNNEFAQWIVVDHSPQWNLSGIFDSSYEPTFDYAGQTEDSEGRHIRFLVQTNLIGSINHRDRLIIKGKPFLVTGLQPIDDGKITSIQLKEDP